MSSTDESTKRARAVAAKLHKAADKFDEVRDLLREAEALLAAETYETTRVYEAKEVRNICEAITFLIRPTRQSAFNWDDYASARARG